MRRTGNIQDTGLEERKPEQPYSHTAKIESREQKDFCQQTTTHAEEIIENIIEILQSHKNININT